MSAPTTVAGSLAISGSAAVTTGNGALSSITGGVTLSGTATFTLGYATTIGGNLSVGDGTTLATASTYTLGVSGTTTVGDRGRQWTSGTLTLAGRGRRPSLGGNGIQRLDHRQNGAAKLSFGSDVTVNNGGTLTENTTSPMSCAGSFLNNGSYTAASGTHTFSGTSKTFGGVITIPSMALTGTYQNNGTLTINGFTTGAGTLTQGASASAVLNIGASSVTPSLVASGSGNTVNYTGSGQTVKPVSYYNLTLSGSGSDSMSGVSTIGGNLTVSGTVTMTSAGALSIGGAFNYGSTSGTTTLGGNVTAASLTVSGSGGILNLGSGLSHQINGGVTVSAGTLNGGSSTLGLTGSMSVSGAWAAGSEYCELQQ